MNEKLRLICGVTALEDTYMQLSQYDSRLGFSFRVLVRITVRVRLGQG